MAHRDILKSMGIFIISVLFLGPLLAAQTAEIDVNDERQYIRGFGGMNCPGWISDLTSQQADKAFGNGQGQIGLSIMRMRISHNSSEFSREAPSARRAVEHGAILLASPWTPPANMKTNNNIVGGELASSSYGAYAAHLKSFCDFMAENEAPLYAVSIQNEPDIQVDYESCDWTPAQMVDFLKNHADAIGSTRIAAPESFQFRKNISDAILNDPAAESKVSIIGGHIYGGGLEDYPLAREKGKEVWMTEHYSDTDSANIWSGALKMGKEIHDCMAANFNAYIWWYIRRFYGLIDDNSNVTKRGYVMAQFSKFIRPGYIRIGTPASPANNIDVTAYIKDGSMVIVVLNRNSSSRDQEFSLQNSSVSSFTQYTTSSNKNIAEEGTISVDGNSFTVSLEAQSVTTLVSEESTGSKPADLKSTVRKAGLYRHNNGFILTAIGNFTYTIYSLNGSILESGKGSKTASIGRDLNRGLYIIKIRTGELDETIKAIND